MNSFGRKVVLSRAGCLGVAPQERDEGGRGMARRHLIITRSRTGMMLGEFFLRELLGKDVRRNSCAICAMLVPAR